MLRKAFSRIVPRRAKDMLRAVVYGDRGPTDASEGAGFVRILRAMGPAAETVFDIGANIGDVTLTMLDTFPCAIVYAFEPCTATYEHLASRVAAAPGGDRVRLFKHGFYDRTTSLQLHVTSSSGANSLVEMAPEYREANPDIEECGTEEIALLRLDDFVAERGIAHIDLIKVDVEGSELEVLEGARETLRTMVDTVMCELSFVRQPRKRGEFIRILQLLHECGFAPAEIYDVAQGETGSVWHLGQFDCVFRRFGA